MYAPTTKEAYKKVLPLPEMDEASAVLRYSRALLIISPDGKVPPAVVNQFFANLTNKNNLLVLTGEKSTMASLEKAARHVYAAAKANNEISATHPQRKELDEKIAQYEQDFQATVLNVFDKLLFPGFQGQDLLRSKVLDNTYPSNEKYNGERQVIKTLTSDPIKLYTQISENFDSLRARAEQLLFGNQDEARKTDLIDKMRQKTQMPWLPPKGLDELIMEACKRGAWEDLGNGYITKKPKTTQVIISDVSSSGDDGAVKLKIDTVNAGNSPRIHYMEDGTVDINSPVLSDSILTTRALRVQFLAVDPTGKNQTGSPYTWTNHLVLRCNLNENDRTLELLVAPRGTIRYTLDGSEPRNGKEYTFAIQLPDTACSVYVFAEYEGLEEKRTFQFPAKGDQDINIVKEKPAQMYCTTPKRLDNSAKTYEGLKIAKEKGITFEQVSLQIGSAPRVIHLSMGDLRIQADFIEKELNLLQTIMNADAPVLMTFKKVFTHTGYDLEQFAKSMGIELKNGEVIQE